jgi:hypothetical protein
VELLLALVAGVLYATGLYLRGAPAADRRASFLASGSNVLIHCRG